MAGTARTENAPACITATPYNTSHTPGISRVGPLHISATVSRPPAASAGSSPMNSRRPEIDSMWVCSRVAL